MNKSHTFLFGLSSFSGPLWVELCYIKHASFQTVFIAFPLPEKKKLVFGTTAHGEEITSFLPTNGSIGDSCSLPLKVLFASPQHLQRGACRSYSCERGHVGKGDERMHI